MTIDLNSLKQSAYEEWHDRLDMKNGTIDEEWHDRTMKNGTIEQSAYEEWHDRKNGTIERMAR